MTKITADHIKDMKMRAMIGDTRSHIAAGQSAIDQALANLPRVPMIEAEIEGELIADLHEHLKLAENASEIADEHWLKAGRLLIRLKRCKPKQQRWADYVKEKTSLKVSRANELIRIAEGRTTVERQRENTAKRVRKHRVKPQRTLRNVHENADEMPTEEEAEEEYQQTIYEQACSMVADMTNETRRKFFAHIRRKYDDVCKS